jgi:hypothetical protein
MFDVAMFDLGRLGSQESIRLVALILAAEMGIFF